MNILMIFKGYRDLKAKFQSTRIAYERLHDLVWAKGGFIDAKGVLRNSDGGDKTIAENWHEFHEIDRALREELRK